MRGTVRLTGMTVDGGTSPVYVNMDNMLYMRLECGPGSKTPRTYVSLSGDGVYVKETPEEVLSAWASRPRRGC